MSVYVTIIKRNRRATMIISMKNVHYKRQGKTILEDINWEFRKGERWAILGLNGLESQPSFVF